MVNPEDELKPVAKFSNADGNVFNLMGIAAMSLKKAGYPEEAEEMLRKVMQSGSYEEALQIMGEYVNIQ